MAFSELPAAATAPVFGSFAAVEIGSEQSNSDYKRSPSEPFFGTSVVEFQLNEDLLAVFCRRGRRRLRDIQMACDVNLRLDRAQGVLRAAGSPGGIAAVRKQLASLGGPRRSVPAAVWAELMRTRTVVDAEQGAIMRMQEKCGCRIHIERSRHEVRLFGEDHAIAMADQLLDEMAEEVTQEAIPINDCSKLSAVALQGLAHVSCVSLRVEPARVVVLGLRQKVAEAVVQVREYLADAQSHKHPQCQDASNPQPADVSSLQDDAASSTDCSEPLGPRVETHTATGAVVNSGNLAPVASAGMCVGTMQCWACPTCGCGRFCSSCGTSVWQVKSMDLATYAAYAAQAQMANPVRKNAYSWESVTPDSEQGCLSLAGEPQTPEAVWALGTCFGGRADDGAAGMGFAGVVPTLIPMCMVPAGMQNALQDGSAHPSVMQACMVPAAAVANGCMIPEQGYATFCTPVPYHFVQDSRDRGG